MKNEEKDENETFCARMVALRKGASELGERMFLGIPDRWYEGGKWRCVNGHVSDCILKTAKGDRCLECNRLVLLTFPEDVEFLSPRTEV